MGHNLRSVSPQISQRGASYLSTDTARRALLGQSQNKTDSKFALFRKT